LEGGRGIIYDRIGGLNQLDILFKKRPIHAERTARGRYKKKIEFFENRNFYFSGCNIFICKWRSLMKLSLSVRWCAQVKWPRGVLIYWLHLREHFVFQFNRNSFISNPIKRPVKYKEKCRHRTWIDWNVPDGKSLKNVKNLLAVGASQREAVCTQSTPRDRVVREKTRQWPFVVAAVDHYRLPLSSSEMSSFRVFSFCLLIIYCRLWLFGVITQKVVFIGVVSFEFFNLKFEYFGGKINLN